MASHGSFRHWSQRTDRLHHGDLLILEQQYTISQSLLADLASWLLFFSHVTLPSHWHARRVRISERTASVSLPVNYTSPFIYRMNSLVPYQQILRQSRRMLVACPIPTCPSIIHGAGKDDSEGSFDQPMCFLDKLLGSSGCGNNSILTSDTENHPVTLSDFSCAAKLVSWVNSCPTVVGMPFFGTNDLFDATILSAG